MWLTKAHTSQETPDSIRGSSSRFRFFEKGKAVSLRFNVECESGFDKMNNFWKRYFFSGTVSTKKKTVEIKSYFQVHNTIEHFKNDLRKCIEEAVKE